MRNSLTGSKDRNERARTLQLGQEIECQLELAQDFEELVLTRTTCPHRQQAVPSPVTLSLVISLLQLAQGSSRMLQPDDEALDVIETVVQDGDVSLVR